MQNEIWNSTFVDIFLVFKSLYHRITNHNNRRMRSDCDRIVLKSVGFLINCGCVRIGDIRRFCRRIGIVRIISLFLVDFCCYSCIAARTKFQFNIGFGEQIESHGEKVSTKKLKS